MKYDTSKPFPAKCAREYLERLISRGYSVEVKHIRKTRNTNQNAFLHKLLALWGLHFGYTTEESKQLVKTALGYRYQKSPSKTWLYKETSAMNTAEFAAFVDKFRRWSADECNCYLPTSEEYHMGQDDYDNMIEQNKNLL